MHAKTILMTWFVMLCLLIFVFICLRKLTSGTPGKMQNILEWLVDFVRGMISDNIDYKKGGVLLSYLLSLILFIFFCNLMGLFPNILSPIFNHIQFAGISEMFGTGTTLMSPTADINTDFALALITITLVVFFGLKYKKLHYFGHFIKPHPAFSLIHVIDFVSKPLTLAFRLFGNIYSGEMLVAVILMPKSAAALAGIIPLPIWLIFCTFIAVIQSYVFTILTLAYIGQAVED